MGQTLGTLLLLLLLYNSQSKAHSRYRTQEVNECFPSMFPSKVPSNGPEGLLNDYTLSADQIKKSESKSKAKVNTCELCDEQGTAVSYCTVCSSFLCDSCTSAHKTVKFLKSHKIESLSSKKVQIPSKKTKVLHCSQHPEECLKLYCKNCQCLACLLCFVASHNGHDLGNIDSETRKGVEKQIEDLVTEVESKLTEYEENLEYIDEVEKETVDEPVQIKAEINSLFDSLATTLESRRAVLLETVESSFSKDLKELWAQKEHVETTIASLRGTLTFARRSLQCIHDLELLLLGSQVMARLKELNKIQWDSDSTVTIDMTSRKFSHKKPTGLNKLGEINRFTMTPTSMGVYCEMPSSAQLGHQVKFDVAYGVKLKKLVARKRSQQVSIKILHGSSRTEILHPPIVTPNPNGRTWSVTFTPIVSGAHVVQVEAKVQPGNKEMKSETVINVTGEVVVGDRIQRGPDWCSDYDDEDGGDGSEGVVSQVTTDEYNVSIEWDNGAAEEYRWGTEDFYDLQLTH